MSTKRPPVTTGSRFLVLGRRAFRSTHGSVVRGAFDASTATLFVLPETLAEALESRTEPLSDAQVEALSRADLLSDQGRAEAYLSGLEDASNDLSTRTFTLLPTPACNMGCDYCGQQHTGKSLKRGYQDLVVPRISAVIRDPRTRNLHIDWFGGEPLLAQAELFSIAYRLRALADANEVTYHSQLTTNGSLFTNSLLRELVLDAGVTRIDVTVDGPQEVHDASRKMKNGSSTYERILSNVRWALGQSWSGRCDFILRTNVTMQTLPTVTEYLHDLARRGLTGANGPSLQIAPVHDWSLGTDAYQTSVTAFAAAEIEWFNLAVDLDLNFFPLPGLAREPCSAGHRGTEIIDPQGFVYDCPELALQPRGPVFLSLDTVRRGSARARPDSDLMDSMPWSATAGPPSCDTCALLPVCGGACALSRSKGQAQCPTMKHNFPERIDAALRRMLAPAHEGL